MATHAADKAWSHMNTTEDIIAAIRAGEMVVILDDEERENEGDLIMAATKVRAEDINFMAKYGRGLICLTLTRARCEQLRLPLMVSNTDVRQTTNFTISIEAAEGIATGISAHDRALTIKVASSENASAADIVHPGHVFPLIAHPGGVLARAGHTEACCDFARLAGLPPAAVLCEIMRDDGTMARLPDLLHFAAEHKLKIGTIADLIEYRSRNESLVQREGERDIDTPWGRFRLVSYRDRTVGAVHMALVHGVPDPKRETVVRVHEPLSILDLLDAGKGTHSWGVGEALGKIQETACGVMVLMNCNQEGERAPKAGRSFDLRLYGIGAQILRDLGVGKMKLMAAPRKMPSMAGFGLEVTGYLQR